MPDHKKVVVVVAVIVPLSVFLIIGIAIVVWQVGHPSKRVLQMRADVEEARQAEKRGEELSWEQKKTLEKAGRHGGRQNVYGFWCGGGFNGAY